MTAMERRPPRVETACTAIEHPPGRVDTRSPRLTPSLVGEARLRRLFTDHSAAVHRYVVRREGPDCADDIVAETFLAAWRRIVDIPPEAELPWLIVTAKWAIQNDRRSRQRRERLADALADTREPPAPDPAVSVADRDLVMRALSQLSPMDAEILKLTEWDDLSAADAAHVVGCSRSVYTVRLHRARKRFKVALGALAEDRRSIAHSQPKAPADTAAASAPGIHAGKDTTP